MMTTTSSLPELKLYTFTNKSPCGQRSLTPWQGKQIIRQQKRAKSCVQSKLHKNRYSCTTSSNQSRPISTLSRSTAIPTPNPHSLSRCISRTQTPGYTLSRTRSSVEIKINTNAFFNTEKDYEKNEQKKKLIEEMIQKSADSTTVNNRSVSIDVVERLTQESLDREEKLQTEIVNLQIQLKFVERKRDEENNQKEDDLKLLTAKLSKAFETDRKKLQTSFESEMKIVHEKHEKAMEAVQAQKAMERVQFEETIQHHIKELEKTKVEMRDEAEKRLNSLKEVMEKRSKYQLEAAMKVMNEEKVKEIACAKDKVAKQYQGKIKALETKYDAKIQLLESKNEGLVKLVDDLEMANETIKQLEAENQALEEEQKIKAKDIAMLESNLRNTETTLDDLQQNYKSKIRSFEEQYFKQFDDLRLENTKLRSKVMEQVSVISNHRVTVDRIYNKRMADMNSRMKAIIQARVNAELTLIPQSMLKTMLQLQDREPVTTVKSNRRLSTPGTALEYTEACKSASADQCEET